MSTKLEEKIEETIEEKPEEKPSLQVPAFGYELIRSVLLPELLGSQERNILYWAGRNLARKFPLLSMEEVISFFHEAGWGNLEIIETTKKEMTLELSSPMITERFQNHVNPVFGLEAGFIAEQVQLQKKWITETFETIKRKNKVVFTVQWDRKDQTDE